MRQISDSLMILKNSLINTSRIMFREINITATSKVQIVRN